METLELQRFDEEVQLIVGEYETYTDLTESLHFKKAPYTLLCNEEEKELLTNVIKSGEGLYYTNSKVIITEVDSETPKTITPATLTRIVGFISSVELSREREIAIEEVIYAHNENIKEVIKMCC